MMDHSSQVDEPDPRGSSGPALLEEDPMVLYQQRRSADPLEPPGTTPDVPNRIKHVLYQLVQNMFYSKTCSVQIGTEHVLLKTCYVPIGTEHVNMFCTNWYRTCVIRFGTS